MPRQRQWQPRQTMMDLYTERDRMHWCWRFLATLSALLILMGYVLLGAAFEGDSGFGNILAKYIAAAVSLAVGYTLSIALWILCKNWIFLVDVLFIPCFSSCILGFLNTANFMFLRPTRSILNPGSISSLALSLSSASTYLVLALLVFRRIHGVRSRKGVYGTILDNGAYDGEMLLPEDEAQRQQLLRLLLRNGADKANTAASQSTFRIDIPENNKIGRERLEQRYPIASHFRYPSESDSLSNALPTDNLLDETQGQEGEVDQPVAEQRSAFGNFSPAQVIPDSAGPVSAQRIPLIEAEPGTSGSIQQTVPIHLASPRIIQEQPKDEPTLKSAQTSSMTKRTNLAAPTANTTLLPEIEKEIGYERGRKREARVEPTYTVVSGDQAYNEALLEEAKRKSAGRKPSPNPVRPEPRASNNLQKEVGVQSKNMSRQGREVDPRRKNLPALPPPKNTWKDEERSRSREARRQEIELSSLGQIQEERTRDLQDVVVAPTIQRVQTDGWSAH